MRRRAFGVLVLASTLALAVHGLAQAPSTPDAPATAKTWASHAKEIEAYLRTAEIVGAMTDLSVGVTRPHRAQLAPGGIVDQIVWKPLKPGRYEGFWESYKSEIAAYELDKVLDLGMVPPTVEKQFKGEMGAAVMWVSPAKSFKELGGVPGQKGIPGPPGYDIPSWTKQLARAKMFDNLIGNTDPNLGNWLVDPSWNIILIDHSRAFTTTKELYHQLQYVDGPLWDNMQALDEARLTSALGKWLDKPAIAAMLQRRAKMALAIDKILAANSSMRIR
jgi:hypothetical protein